MDFGTMNVQLVVPKIPEASQIQHNMNQAATVNQAVEAERQKQDATLKEKQVRAREELEDGRVKDDPDAEERRGGGYGGNRRRAKSSIDTEDAPKEKMAVDTFRGRNIDIQG